MNKDLKILLGALGFTLLLVIGFAFWQGKPTEGNESSPDVNSTSEVLGVEIDPLNYDLGQVPINGGIVTKEYEVKNTTENTLKLKKIATSCMCTTASFELGDKKTKFFGMEGHGDSNPSVNIEIGPGQTGKVVARFDPAAHGPQGVGPIDRSVFLTFSDPAGIKEMKFNGTVVN
jgi:hypothetical protein